jgi:hypothetical protein
MKLREDALAVKILFIIIADIMVVGSGVHLHLPTKEIFVLNLGNQSLGI